MPRPRDARSWILVAASALSVFIAGRAFAEAPTVAHVSVSGSEDAATAFLDALREPLEGLGLRMRATRVSEGLDLTPAVDAAPCVWIDARQADHVDILVWVGPDRERGPVRRTLPHDGARESLAVEAEEVAYAVRATLEAMLAPLPPAPPPLPTPPLLPPAPPTPPPPTIAAELSPPHPPPPRSSFVFDTVAFGSVTGTSSSAATWGGGVALNIAPWGARQGRPGLWVSGAVNASFDTKTTEVLLSTTLYSVRIMPTIELLNGARVHVAAEAGAGIDFFHVETSATDTFPVGLAPATNADAVVAAGLLARVRIVERLGLLFALNVDVDLSPHDYMEVDSNRQSTPVLAPWRVRPSALFGICIPLTSLSGCTGIE